MILDLEKAAKDRSIRFNVFKRVKIDAGTDALLVWIQHLPDGKEFYYFGTERNDLFAALEKTDAPTTELFASRFEEWVKEMQASVAHKEAVGRLDKREQLKAEQKVYSHNPLWGMF